MNRCSSLSAARPRRAAGLVPVLVAAALWGIAGLGPGAGHARASAPISEAPLDFNRDVRPILSQNCFTCHGPDENKRKGGAKGGLRLDTPSGQRQDLGGHAAVVPGNPEASELIRRVNASDEDDLMPPASSGMRLSEHEVSVLRRWIAEGAPFAVHWSYERPVRPPPPEVSDPGWPRLGLDRFVLARLEREGLRPQPEADRHTLARRAALDLTGLPPTPEEVDRFLADAAPAAFERYVEGLLAKPAFGEHWGRHWLDLARYADSAGYADDPPRTIWPYRDYVIEAFNRNLPFDQFTVEQLAGDLLPEPTEDQLKATAFHRNTMTNSEGGTSDEEFRNVAVVDRVNTTFAVWMGTSMACAQCHSHKYDPISQKEYFQLFAFFNNTADADRPDEAPLFEFYPEDLKGKRARLDAQYARLDALFRSPDPQWVEAAHRWARIFPVALDWQDPRPAKAEAASGASMDLLDDNSVRVGGTGKDPDTYTVEIPFDTAATLTGLRLEALPRPDLEKEGPGFGGDFMVRRVRATVVPVPNQAGPSARYVRIELPGSAILQLAEVEVFSQGANVARSGAATQSSTYEEAGAARAIDGDTRGEYALGSVSHTQQQDDPWWEVDLGEARPVERIVVWNRTEAGERLKGFRVTALDASRKPVWRKVENPAPSPSAAFELTGGTDIAFATAAAEVNLDPLDEALVVTDKPVRSPARRRAPGERGWSIGDATGKAHALIMRTAEPVDIPRGATLVVRIEQPSTAEKRTLARFRVGVTQDTRIAAHTDTPTDVLASLRVAEAERDPGQRQRIVEHFARHVAPGLQEERERLADLERQRDAIKPHTVPVARELSGDTRRETRIQLRGDFQITTDVVDPEVPAAWPALPADAPRTRLSLARWLVRADNPLTARVVANRFWEQIFGVGIVRTSEEFGSQGELPVNRPLLDWLACELVAMDWDMKRFLKMLVTSASYRQSSRVTPEALEKDPDNRLLSRGPRFRMGAEAVRDQALAVAGLLSGRMLGPSVRPPRPNLDLRAAFGGNLDWQPSAGEQRYRRGLYTEWRRTSPYPSMVTFDAPSREVCTLRRTRSNTPLQALVTLNDPVFVEAAQGLARRMMAAGSSAAERLRHGFRLVLARPPTAVELAELEALQGDAREAFAREPEKAQAFATEPLGAPPAGMDPVDLAAWTAVANVLLNLDETLMSR